MVIGQVIGSGIFFKVDDVLLSTQGNILAGLFGFIIVGVSVIFVEPFSRQIMRNCSQKTAGFWIMWITGSVIKQHILWDGCIWSLFLSVIIIQFYLRFPGFILLICVQNSLNFEPTTLHFALIGFVNLLIFFTFNIFRPKSSGVFQQFTTVLKVLPLIFIASMGILSLVKL